jgi:rod shape-determining protein MreC
MSTAARREIAVYIALLVLCLLLLAFSNSGPLLELRKGVGFALAPFQDTLRQGTRTVTSVFSTINDIEGLRQQNEDLTRRIQEVDAENQRLQSLAVENQQLAALLEVRSSLSYDTVAAEVLNRLTSDQERVISIDRGTDVGISVDDPVVAEGGALVGKVIEVGPNFSRVLLINDTRTNVAGLIETSRALGDIRGNGERPLQMTNIPATDEVTVGESVVTAGIELETGVRSTYPKGLLIGQIVDVQREPNQLFQTALVQPTASLDRLEYVLVITDYEGGVPDASSEPGASIEPGASLDPEATPEEPAATP